MVASELIDRGGAMRKLKRSLKCLAIAYIVALVFVIAHVPKLASFGIRSGHPAVLLAPILAPQILTAYGQVMIGSGWPFRENSIVVDTDALIAVSGRDNALGYDRGITFNVAPWRRPGEEGRAERTLTSESYADTVWGGFTETRTGILIRVGDYICLAPDTRIYGFFALRSRCFLLTVGHRGRYFWKQLGETKASESTLVSYHYR